MGLRKMIAKLVMGSTKGLHPNSQLALQRVNKESQIRKLERELNELDGRSNDRTIMEAHRTPSADTARIREPPTSVRGDGEQRGRGYVEDDRGHHEGASEEGEEMNPVDTMKQMFELQNLFLENQQKQKQAIRDEILEVMSIGSPGETDAPESMEERFMEKVVLNAMNNPQSPQAPPPIADGTGTPPPSPTPTLEVGEGSGGEGISEEQAVIMAQKAATSAPKWLLRRVQKGEVSDNMAITYGAGHGMSKEDSLKVFSALKDHVLKEGK